MYKAIYEIYKKLSPEFIKRPYFNQSQEPAKELIEDIKKNKLVIYTAFTGNYDSLKQPEFVDENCDYICFTDNPNLKSDFWKIIPMEESTLDNNRKAKQYKVLPHKYLKDYKYSFWLDGTFKIKGSIREYIYCFLKEGSKILNVVHTERDCIYDEAAISPLFPRYPRVLIEEQVARYESEGFPRHYGLPVLGAIFRVHNDPEVIGLMEDWWEEIIRYSNQDQISFSYLAWKRDIHPSVGNIYYWINEYWEKEGQYHHNVVIETPITSDNLLPKIEEKLCEMKSKDTLELSKEETYILINDVIGMKGYCEDTARNIQELDRIKNEILNSNSLKVTKPLRIIEKIQDSVKSGFNENKKRYYKYLKLNKLEEDDLDDSFKRVLEEISSNFYITDPNITIPYGEYHNRFETDTIKVGVFLGDNYSHMNACPYLRIHTPLKELSKSGKYHFFVYGREHLENIDIDKFMSNKVFDMILVQRISFHEKDFLKKAKNTNMRIIYETDDDLLNVPPSNSAYKVFQDNYKPLKEFIENADAVVVSTEGLKEKFTGFDVDVIKNYHLSHLLPFKELKPAGDEIKIGYFGTITHEGDLKIIENAIREVKSNFAEKGKTIRFEVVGAIDHESDWFEYVKLPYYPMDMEAFMNWLRENVSWDIGIVPLEDNPFNNSKSELKYIEFTALGVPIVASDIGEYHRTIKNGKTGFIVPNEEKYWVERLSQLIENESLRGEILENAQEDIKENYNLESRVKQWDNLLDAVYNY